MKVYTLTTCNPGDPDPCLPSVFSSQELADKAFDNAMRSEWESNAPCDHTGERLPYPEDANEAHRIMAENPEWGRWEVLVVTVDDDPYAGALQTA